MYEPPFWLPRRPPVAGVFLALPLLVSACTRSAFSSTLSPLPLPFLRFSFSSLLPRLPCSSCLIPHRGDFHRCLFSQPYDFPSNDCMIGTRVLLSSGDELVTFHSACGEREDNNRMVVRINPPPPPPRLYFRVPDGPFEILYYAPPEPDVAFTLLCAFNSPATMHL